MKKIVLTGGGTAGHVTPHFALLPFLKENGYDIHYIGSKNGPERTLMDIEGVTYHPIQSGKLRRYFSWQNFTDVFRIIVGIVQSFFLILKIKPNVCFSKGGFVAVPVVVATWLNKVPTLCHESDLTPGLANKICAKFVPKIATTFPECAKMLGAKGMYIGTPMRPELFQGERSKGLQLANFSGDRPVLMMVGGSLGAQKVNEVLRASLATITKTMDVFHICGKGNMDATLQGMEGYAQFEYLNEDMPHAFACADIVLSRAGSNAICELLALHKPMLLVPYPKAATSRGDQVLNAKSFKERGIAHVLEQERLTKETLCDALETLYTQKEDLIKAMQATSCDNGAGKIIDWIKEKSK